MNSNAPPGYAYAVLLSAQLAVGAAAIFARYGLQGAGPLAVSALRLSLAALPLLALSWTKSRTLGIPRRHELLFLSAGAALAVHFAAWIWSLLYTTVAISTLLVSTVPVWTALYDWLVLKKKVSLGFWVAMVTAGSGIVLIVSSKTSAPPVAGFEELGCLLALIGSMAFAGYLILVRFVSDLYPTLVIVGRTYSWAALLLSISALSLQQMPPDAADSGAWAGIVAMALVSQTCGHTGMNASLRWFSSSTVAFSTLLEPVIAAVLAGMLFTEGLSILTIFGSLMVLGSLAAILRLQSKQSPEEGKNVDG